jgi:hypothetical protein
MRRGVKTLGVACGRLERVIVEGPMPVAEEVQSILRDMEKERRGTEAFERLREFRERMLCEGLLVAKPYDLPPVDTIGRRAYHPGGP